VLELVLLRSRSDESKKLEIHPRSPLSDGLETALNPSGSAAALFSPSLGRISGP
jgi:hypothetical protein